VGTAVIAVGSAATGDVDAAGTSDTIGVAAAGVAAPTTSVVGVTVADTGRGGDGDSSGADAVVGAVGSLTTAVALRGAGASGSGPAASARLMDIVPIAAKATAAMQLAAVTRIPTRRIAIVCRARIQQVSLRVGSGER